jgi:ABC-type Fe3+-siderophore transport system permease subunit
VALLTKTPTVRCPLMSGWADPESHVVPVARLIASLAVGLILAAMGGMVLGEYTFQGVGIQWLSISGGVGLGAVIAWVLNRVWAHHPPLWMCAVAGLLSMAGEALAVQRDMDGACPPEGWAAVLLAGVAGAYGIYSANKVAAQERAKKS